MKTPTLPAEPIDGYTLTWFEVVGGKINEIKAVYHVNTAFEAIANGQWGAPLIDQWMVYINSAMRRRLESWDDILREDWWMADATRDEAVKIAIDYWERKLNKAMETIAECEAEIRKLKP